MDTLSIMLKNVIIFVLLAIPGFIMVKGKLLDQKESGSLSKMLTTVGMPFLIFSSTLKLEFSKELTKSIIIVGIIGIIFTFFMFASTILFTAKEQNEKTKGMMRFCMIFANSGFIGIPIARAVFGDGTQVMAYVIILNIITNVLLFTIGIYMISKNKDSIKIKKVVLNPVLLAFIIGIIVNVFGVCDYVPEVQIYATHFSNIVTPMSMVVLGMKLAGVKFSLLFTSWRLYYVTAVRLFLFPVIAVALWMLLKPISVLSLNPDAVIAAFIAFGMPTAGLASAFADQYNSDTESAVIFTLGTTVLSIITIPILYWVLRMFV